MTGLRNLNAIDQYAHEITADLWPGSQVLVSPMDSRSETKGTYTLLTPENNFAVVKFAIPAEFLERDDADHIYSTTIDELASEARVIKNMKRSIKEQASYFEDRGDTPPAIWIPEMYREDERGFIREWISGKYVTSIDDLFTPSTSRYAKDLTIITEGMGYAGFKALAMDDNQPAINGRSIRTKLISHYSPYADAPVLSPTEYQSIKPANDPSFKELQREDFVHAGWLIRLADLAQENRTE